MWYVIATNEQRIKSNKQKLIETDNSMGVNRGNGDGEIVMVNGRYEFV